MNNNVYLSEENYQKNNMKVKKIGNIILIVGSILLVIGIVMSLIGFIMFGSQIFNGFESGQTGINASNMFSGISSFAIGGSIASVGFTVIFVGIIVRFVIGNRREITAYTTQQVMPIAKEGIEAMAPTVGTVAKEITKGIKDGLKDDKNS